MSFKNDDLLKPKASKAMNNLKLNAANETIGREQNRTINSTNYEQALDEKKWEAANDLGLTSKIENQGWENLTTKEVGQIGGRVGGKIGGNMVKNLIAAAEAQMAPVDEDAKRPEELDN